MSFDTIHVHECINSLRREKEREREVTITQRGIRQSQRDKGPIHREKKDMCVSVGTEHTQGREKKKRRNVKVPLNQDTDLVKCI